MNCARRWGPRQCFATGTLLPLLLSACAPPTAKDQPSRADDFAERAKQPADRGERLFIQCKSCHLLEKDAGHGVGPNLFGIVGSQAGSAQGFHYSEALETADLVWTEENLDQFLKNPNQFVQGTSMTFAGISDPAQRRQIIEFLGQNE